VSGSTVWTGSNAAANQTRAFENGRARKRITALHRELVGYNDPLITTQTARLPVHHNYIVAASFWQFPSTGTPAIRQPDRGCQAGQSVSVLTRLGENLSIRIATGRLIRWAAVRSRIGSDALLM
jgi:hypothetical protein